MESLKIATSAAASPFFLAISSILLLLIGIVRPLRDKTGYAALIAALTAFFFLRYPNQDFAMFSGMAIISGQAVWLWKIILAALSCTAFISISFRLQYPGIYYFLLFISSAGAMMAAAADNIFFAFIAAEIAVIPLYFLSACRKGRQGLFAAYKFSASGMFFAAITMLGIAFLNYSCSSLSLRDLSQYGLPDGLALTGFILFSAGFSFKMLALPFNLTFRDVYSYSPAAISAYMAAAWSLSAIPVLYKVSCLFYSGPVHDFFSVLAIITVISGAFFAFYGRDMRRIACGVMCMGTGFSLLAFGGTQTGEIALLYHLPAYAAAVAGLFIFSFYFEREELSIPLSGLAGFSERHPIISLSAAIVLFSAVGLPPFGGFFAKFMILFSLIKEGSFYTACAGCVSMFITCWCCIRIVSAVFFQNPIQDENAVSDRKGKNGDIPLSAGFAITAIAVFLAIYGIFSSYFLDRISKFI